MLKSSSLMFIQFKFEHFDPWVVPFQNCVRQRRSVSKMAAMTSIRNFFKWSKLLYFKPESAQI
jgi:hypothetical protein